MYTVKVRRPAPSVPFHRLTRKVKEICRLNPFISSEALLKKINVESQKKDAPAHVQIIKHENIKFMDCITMQQGFSGGAHVTISKVI